MQLHEIQLILQFFRIPDIIRIQKRNISSLCFHNAGITCFCSTFIMLLFNKANAPFVLLILFKRADHFLYYFCTIIFGTVIYQQKFPVFICLIYN